MKELTQKYNQFLLESQANFIQPSFLNFMFWLQQQEKGNDVKSMDGGTVCNHKYLDPNISANNVATCIYCGDIKY